MTRDDSGSVAVPRHREGVATVGRAQQADITTLRIDALNHALRGLPEERTRYRARIELGGRDTKEVMAALKPWLAKCDNNGPNSQHDLMEALWLHQSHNVVDEPLLKRMLRSPDFHARAAATRVLCYWRDGIQDPLSLLKVQANDEHPRVRLEAIRACSFFTTAQATEVALEVLTHPMDKYLKYTLDETMNTLDRFTKQARD